VVGLFQRRVNVDELVSIAILASLARGEFLTAAVVSFVMVMGSLIEQVTSQSARRSIQGLIEIAPETATVMVNGESRERPISSVQPGDLLLVKPGERIPVDGRVRKGSTAIDESSMTGEPIPVEKGPGAQVFAGTLNHNGVIQIEAERVGADTNLGKVIKLVADAEAYKPRTVRIIDRYAHWFTPLILCCAAVAWALTGIADRAIAVLIVGCPCALILAAPTAVVAAIGRAARLGILVKGGSFLEEIAQADVVLFDKTGTLTEGKPRVNQVVAVDGVEPRQVLAGAASVEQHSTHPLARAVLKAAHYARLSLEQAEDVFTEIGLGVRAQVAGSLIEVGSAYLGGGSLSLPANLHQELQECKESGATPLVVYRDRSPWGLLSVADQVRPGAPAMVEKLKALGVRHLGILSGDHEQAARLVADSVGLTEAWSQMKPADKLKVIREYQDAGHKVVFVGDGINDAPALASADVGVAMGGAGTDVALETADVALMHDEIDRLPFLVQLSRRMVHTIRWNIVFGMVFNAFAVLASGSGLLSPIMGAVVHNIGSVLVVLSSASIAFSPGRR
jgi:Cd2+/Zn2+-exporting ATPase